VKNSIRMSRLNVCFRLILALCSLGSATPALAYLESVRVNLLSLLVKEYKLAVINYAKISVRSFRLIAAFTGGATFLLGCTTVQDPSSKLISNPGADVAMTFPAWVSDSEKRKALSEEAKTKAIGKCGAAPYEIVNIQSFPYAYSGGMNRISATINCQRAEVVQSAPQGGRERLDRSTSNMPICSGSDISRWTNCHGTATLSWGKYVGEFRDGKFHGQGIGTTVNGNRYVGEHRDGKPHGQGTFTFASGNKYVGEFRDGKRHGQGTFTMANGDKHVGQYTDDKRNGQGIVTFADGRPPLEGFFADDKFFRAERIPDHIAGRVPTTPPPVSQAPRQAEPPRSTLSLAVTPSSPDTNGVVLLTVSTGSDTASLKVNGDEEGGRADGRYSVRRFARVGENKFEVVATDRFGNTQRQTVSVVREPADTTVRFATLNPGALRGKPANNTVAIIIGIQDYRRVPKAEFANNDARVFYDYAIRGLGVRPENVKLLVDQQADDVEILGAFKNWLPLKAKRGQTDVYVFYSGHGLPSDDGASLYFLPHGVDRQFLDRTAIKQAEIVSALQAVSPKSVTLFLDACYSGQSRGGETLLASARPIAIQPKASTFPSNFTVLSASAPEQIASSSPDLKHGIFSYFLMKGMEGEADQNKDGSITVAEMQAYLSESVGRKAMSINRTQQPQLVGDQSRVLVGR